MDAKDLTAWQRRCGFPSDKQAAHALGLAAVTYRKKRTGRGVVDKRTALLCAYTEAFGGLAKLRELGAAVDVLIRAAEALPPAIRMIRR